MQALDRHDPAHGIDLTTVRAALTNRFPWHSYDQAHPELNDPETWWSHTDQILRSALAGLDDQASREVLGHFRQLYLDPSTWTLFPDSAPALEALSDAGWANIIVSNHVPELAELVEGLGIAGLVTAVLSSAVHGFEKPHPQAFRLALQAAGDPGEVWMVGDNPIADIAGAAAVGIPGILVRAPVFDDDYVARMESSYTGGQWPDWQLRSERTAADAAEAAQLILCSRRHR